MVTIALSTMATVQSYITYHLHYIRDNNALNKLTNWNVDFFFASLKHRKSFLVKNKHAIGIMVNCRYTSRCSYELNQNKWTRREKFIIHKCGLMLVDHGAVRDMPAMFTITIYVYRIGSHLIVLFVLFVLWMNERLT